MARKNPQDPVIRDIVNLIRNQQLNRRSLMKGAAAGAAGLGALGLAACSGGGTGGGGTDENAGGDGGDIVWGNWTYYLDYDEETGINPTLEAFNEEAGYSVHYIEDIDDNNTFYGKIKDALQLEQHTGYDTITLTDWMNERLIEAGQLQEFDYANMPNVENNLLDTEWEAFAGDLGRKYTIPWQLPTTGWAWNKEAFPQGLHELDDLLNPELKGKIQVLSEMRDTIGLILAGQGVDPASDWGDAEFDKAMEWLQDALDSGQINNVKGNDYTQDLETGTMLAGFVWYGDVVMMNYDLDDQWGVEIPEAGGMIAADSFTIPKGTSAESKAKVEELINYYYEPEVAAEVAAYVAYVCPVKGAQEAMQNVDPEQVENPAIFPTDEDMKRLHNFRILTPEEDQRYSTAFQKALGL